MKIYAIAGSPNSRKVQAVINHLGLEVEIDYLDLFQGQHRTPDYLNINPNGMVPALVDGDLKLWESNAIIQYLADKAGDEELFPSAPEKRADVVRWLCWELAHFNLAFGTLAFESVAKPSFMDTPGNPSVIRWTQENLTRFAPILEAHLQSRRYLCGDHITLADYAMIHVEFFKEAVPFDWSAYPNLNAYYERLRKNPHWASTAPNPENIGKAQPQPVS